MVEVTTTNIVFRFPHLAERANLRINFQQTDAPGTVIPIAQTGDEILVKARGQIAMHFRPQILHYAILVNVDGGNALTGNFNDDKLTRPQNYFASPPQGAMDAYRVKDRLLPLRVT